MFARLASFCFYISISFVGFVCVLCGVVCVVWRGVCVCVVRGVGVLRRSRPVSFYIVFSRGVVSSSIILSSLVSV